MGGQVMLILFTLAVLSLTPTAGGGGGAGEHHSPLQRLEIQPGFLSVWWGGGTFNLVFDMH